MMKKHTLAAAFAALFAIAGADSVKTDVTIRRACQDQSGRLNKHELTAGSVRGSRVIGSIETDVRVDSVRQSGLLNSQKANLGSVNDSNVLGAAQTNVYARNIAQSQSGLLNKQKMSVGPVD